MKPIRVGQLILTVTVVVQLVTVLGACSAKDSTENKPPAPQALSSDAERGHLAAKRDLMEGSVKMLGVGTQSGSRWGPKNTSEEFYVKLLGQRCGVQFVEGSRLKDGLPADYDKSYNETVVEWISTRFGADVFVQIRKESRKQYDAYLEKSFKDGKSKIAASPIPHDEYVIQSGDSIYALATRHGLTGQDLVKANKGLNLKRIQIGQRIKFPK